MPKVPHRRQRVTPADRAAILERWRSGWSYSEIARLLKRRLQTVWDVVNSPAHGGGAAKPRGERNEKHLSAAERQVILRSLRARCSLRAIAKLLDRAPSTISREIARNGGRGGYVPEAAERRAGKQARRPKLCKLARFGRLRQVVAAKLRRNWSPTQIAGWLKLHHPTEESMQVSHETIYRSLFIQARGVLKAELLACLRTQRRARRSPVSKKNSMRGKIPDAVSIRERPAEVADRAVPGHWEGDLLIGTHRSCIATLVERSSRFVMLVKVADKRTETVVDALIKQACKLPVELRRSLTWDRGHELAQHKRFSLATDMQVYFCDPHSPWQRGSNENTNALLRQYFPKGRSMADFSQAQLNRVARELNERPRQTLAFQTPAAILERSLR